MKADAQIERGRKLNRLMGHPDFEPLLKEWDERIETAETKREIWSPIQGAGVLAAAEIEIRTLKSLREWVKDEIETGARLLAQQQAKGGRE